MEPESGGGGEKCPVCEGVPERPEIAGCFGCGECDYSGTMDGYLYMREFFREAMEAAATEGGWSDAVDLRESA